MMTPQQHRDYARALIEEHARDIEYMSIFEMADEHAPDDITSDNITDEDAAAVQALLNDAELTIRFAGDSDPERDAQRLERIRARKEGKPAQHRLASVTDDEPHPERPLIVIANSAMAARTFAGENGIPFGRWMYLEGPRPLHLRHAWLWILHTPNSAQMAALQEYGHLLTVMPPEILAAWVAANAERAAHEKLIQEEKKRASSLSEPGSEA